MTDRTSSSDPNDVTANCDDWTKIAMHCRECGVQFFRKVKGQRYCDEHRHLAGAVIRPQGAQTSKTSAGWHRANAVEVPDVPEMIDHPGDTVSCFVAVSDGFRVGRARWHYPTKSWCHKGGYDGEVLFWSLLPNWNSTSDETRERRPLWCCERCNCYNGPRDTCAHCDAPRPTAVKAAACGCGNPDCNGSGVPVSEEV